MRSGERRLMTESPEAHCSPHMQAFISKEVNHPCKKWIHEVIASRRETERVKLRTPEFVLLPDVEINKRKPTEIRRWRPAVQSFHWLAVATDTDLRTLRDLKGGHVPMLQSLYLKTCQRIHEEMGVDPSQIIAYVHYPPSVYQLHVHFKHVAGGHDTLRLHPLPTIINNLTIDPEYYSKSHIQLPVYAHTGLYTALLKNLEPNDSNQTKL